MGLREIESLILYFDRAFNDCFLKVLNRLYSEVMMILNADCSL